MKTITDALVLAIAYIDFRRGDDESLLNDDVRVFESLVAILRDATAEERQQIATAAERALTQAQASPNPPSELISCLQSFMEDMSSNSWTGNDRAE